VPLNPFDDGIIGPKREVQFLTIIGDEGEADESASDPIIFGIEEVSQRGTAA
jgi:hypothetical protein